MKISECLSVVELNAAWPVISQLRSSISQEEFVDRVTAAQKCGYKLFVAVENEMITGAIGFRILDDLAWGHHLYVDDLVVDKKARGKGVGKSLIDFSKREAAKQGCSSVRLCSGLDRDDAHRFYEREGMNKQSYAFRVVVNPHGNSS